jgi:hypothetical protein
MKKVSRKNNHYQGAKLYSSLEEKFLIEFRYLITTIKNYHFLDKDDVETAISNAMVYFIKGCKRKGIDTSDYNNYKNYQYIIISNEVKKANVSRMSQKKTARREHISIDEIDIGDDNTQEMFEYLEAIRDMLTDEEYYVCTELINGYEQKDVMKDFDNSKFKVSKIVERIRKKIFPNMKLMVKKYETRKEAHNTKRQGYVKPEIDYEYNDYYAD